MRQKILLIAAFLHTPDLTLLDEPFSGLDGNAALLHQGRIAANDSIERLRDLMSAPTLAGIFSRLAIEQDTTAIRRDIPQVMECR